MRNRHGFAKPSPPVPTNWAVEALIVLALAALIAVTIRADGCTRPARAAGEEPRVTHGPGPRVDPVHLTSRREWAAAFETSVRPSDFNDAPRSELAGRTETEFARYMRQWDDAHSEIVPK